MMIMIMIMMMLMPTTHTHIHTHCSHFPPHTHTHTAHIRAFFVAVILKFTAMSLVCFLTRKKVAACRFT